MVISGIVRDHDDPPRSSGAGAVESFQEDKEEEIFLRPKT